jgi:hypothetical protein
MKVRSWIGKNKCGSSAPQSREQKLEGVKNHLDNPDRLDGRHDDLRDRLDGRHDGRLDDDDDINDMIED